MNQEDQKVNIGGKRPARFLLAMPDDLRAAIKRAAYISGRTETAEINIRLVASLRSNATPPAPPSPQAPSPSNTGNSWADLAAKVHAEKSPPTAQQPTTTYQAHTSQGPLFADDRTPGAAPLNDHDRALLTVFRQLSPEKQLSLLTLLKP